MPQTIILDKIRRLILLKTGIKSISPSDCRFISISIQKEITKNISETTIKRLFGFAEVKNRFSKYTVNALLDYVEKSGNYELVEKELLHISNINDKFSNIQLNAINITLSTLKSVKNRSSVPYHFTHPRAFAKLDFEYFYNSKYSFTAFISQAGYGKSILLSHLVQSLFIDNDAKHKVDTILFINARDVFDDQNEYSNIEDRIKSKIGLNQRTNLIEYFKDRYERNGSKLVIVIDSFSDLITNRDSKPIVYDKLINLISLIEDEKFVKIVLGMRSTMWSRFYDKIKNIPFIKKKWFQGTYFNIKHHSNIPPLANDEIDIILKKIEPDRKEQINSALKAQLKYPFYIQWYYLLKEEFPRFDSFTNIVFFEIVDRFIHDKIYNTSYATEKTLFCKKIVTLSNHGKGRKSVYKSELIADLSNFKNAYRELLAEGILVEEKQELDGFVVDLVRFVHPHLFEYFLFVELLNCSNNQMDEAFFENINLNYAGNPNRYQILQWSARLLIIKSDFGALKHLLKLNLSNYEKTYLIYFIAENLNYRQHKQPSVAAYLEEDELHHMMMENIIHFDFADSCYKEAICSLLSISKNDKFSFLYLVILSTFDSFSFYKEQLKTRLKAMEKFANEGNNWLINPYELLKCLYSTLAGEEYKNEALLANIEAFKEGDISVPKNENGLPGYREMLSFVLLRTYNTFHGDSHEAQRMLDAMVGYYPKMTVSESVSSAYLFSMMAFLRSLTKLPYSSGLSEKIRLKIFEINSIGNSTPYIQTVYLASRAIESKNEKDYQTAIAYAEKCIEVFKRNRLTLQEILMYNLLIHLNDETGNEEKKDEYVHHKLTLIDKRNVHGSVFHKLK
ncbi:hypothetical protein [Pedobacter xixiisoli]|uniref:NACHT domain-containing protein n=1 Tax=Pedobacter xixiisoli TaxID=1476464 RepID=A0A285ZRA8_9SPHI|nr:hypothetical protein [Pedobacter xixiisoli]SOD12162.1 hypothetical protein SAMN06297358_0525 [Pedobacter xixiisoli]